MLNPDLNYVEIEMGSRTSPSGDELPPAFIAADEALVALELEMRVFNVEREEHAARIARKEIGTRLQNIPLKVLRVEPLSEDGEGADESSAGGGTTRGSGDRDGDGDDGDELIPEFEDLVDDG
jgi:hypothetical protein